MGSDEPVKQCPRCGGGQTGDAPMCQWCGLVDPDSPLGKQQYRAQTIRWLLIGLAVFVVAGIGLAVLFTTAMENSKNQARDDMCDIVYDPERCD